MEEKSKVITSEVVCTFIKEASFVAVFGMLIGIPLMVFKSASKRSVPNKVE